MDRDTVTDMCVDLARCLDTLEQDLGRTLRIVTLSLICVSIGPPGGGRTRALLTMIYREAAGGKRELRQLIKLRHRRTAAHRIAAQLHTVAQVEREHCGC